MFPVNTVNSYIPFPPARGQAIDSLAATALPNQGGLLDEIKLAASMANTDTRSNKAHPEVGTRKSLRDLYTETCISSKRIHDAIGGKESLSLRGVAGKIAAAGTFMGLAAKHITKPLIGDASNVVGVATGVATATVLTGAALALAPAAAVGYGVYKAGQWAAPHLKSAGAWIKDKAASAWTGIKECWTNVKGWFVNQRNKFINWKEDRALQSAQTKADAAWTKADAARREVNQLSSEISAKRSVRAAQTPQQSTPYNQQQKPSYY